MLSIHRLSYQIGQLQILDGLEGSIEAGEIVALVGPNGAGKSTLADIICGFRRPSRGRVLLQGQDITDAMPYVIARLGIARMFQGSHLAWNLTVKANVLAAIREARETKAELKEQRESAMCFLERVGLEDRSAEIARRLSFGQQRLLALARVLARPAKAFVLDEPFSGLKGVALEKIMTIVEEEAQSGKAILIIDHLLSALRNLHCRFWYLAHGRLTEFSAFDLLAESELFRSGYGVSVQSRLETKVPKIALGQAPSPNYKKPVCRVSGKIGYNSTVVIEEVEFKAYGYEVIAIIGLNGAGKSTLLRAISGTCTVLGRVELLGEEVTLLPVHERIRRGLRVLPQDHRLFRNLSMLDNCKLATAVLDRGKKLRDRPGLLTRSSLENRTAGTFSGGEQALSALMMVDYGAWSVMLLDEPTTGLDSSAKNRLTSTIKDWRSQGKSVIFVEHDFDFVTSVASRCYIASRLGLLPVDLNIASTGRALLDKVLALS